MEELSAKTRLSVGFLLTLIALLGGLTGAGVSGIVYVVRLEGKISGNQVEINSIRERITYTESEFARWRTDVDTRVRRIEKN